MLSVFGLGLSDGMVLGAPAVYPLVYSIKILLGLALVNYFVTFEGSLVEVSLVSLAGLMIGTGEGYLSSLSLVLPLGYQLE